MPKRARTLSPMPIFDPLRLPQFLKARGSKRPQLHATVLWRHLLRTPKATLDSVDFVEGFPPSLLAAVQLHFVMFTIQLVRKSTSSDGSTTKMLLRLQDGFDIETVVMRHGCTTARKVEGEKRTTVCVSSQIGCKMGCKFCATGTMGELGDLWSGEIVEQVAMASFLCNVDVRNVVFMGMGEPMNNYVQMTAAVSSLIDQKTFGLSPSRITVSTVGIVPRMEEFTEELGQRGVSLALSLHAPNQLLRASFVPAARAYPLTRLMRAVDIYTLRTKKKILMEYCLMSGVNDAPEHARELGELLTSRKEHVLLNLIPYNDTSVDAKYNAPSRKDVEQFADIVMRDYGVRTTVRKEMGSDVAAACGQLVTQEGEDQAKAKEGGKSGGGGVSSKQQLGDMEDLFGGSMLSVRKKERKEAWKGHVQALERMKHDMGEVLGGGGGGEAGGKRSITLDDMMALVHQEVAHDPTYTPQKDGRPLWKLK
mgnify:CR=1 FL=1